MTITGASVAVRTSLPSRGRRAVESKTTRVGCRRAPTPRAVSRASSAMAVPMPIGDGIQIGAPAVHELTARVARDPLRVAVRGCRPAVEGDGRLQRHERLAGEGALAKRLVEQAGASRGGVLGPADVNAGVARSRRAATAGLRSRVLGADHDPRDARGEDGVGARRLAALVSAGLERHVHRGPGDVGCRAGRRRRARRLRRVGPRVARGSPRRSRFPTGSTITAPTIGLGLTAPRPRAASSRARSM